MSGDARSSLMDEFLRSTKFIDFNNPIVGGLAKKLIEDVDPSNSTEQARRLFYFVRDKIPYNILLRIPTRRDLRASETLKRGNGFCISKATLLVALARAVGIPARLHFADIINRLVSESVRKLMGTNLFVYHGYSEVFLNGEWFKVTPAFDLGLSLDKGYIPVEFDGHSDAVFQKTDSLGNPQFEYVLDRGTYGDVPFTEIVNAWFETYRDAAWAGAKDKQKRKV